MFGSSNDSEWGPLPGQFQHKVNGPLVCDVRTWTKVRGYYSAYTVLGKSGSLDLFCCRSWRSASCETGRDDWLFNPERMSVVIVFTQHFHTNGRLPATLAAAWMSGFLPVTEVNLTTACVHSFQSALVLQPFWTISCRRRDYVLI